MTVSRPGWDWLRAAVVGLLLLGFAIRMYDLTGAPMGISGDEAYYYLDANRILHEGYLRLYYPTNFGHEPLFIYFEAATVALFGGNAFTIRYTAVIGGMLMLSGAYVLAARLVNRHAAVVTLALFATVFWPVFITRVGLRVFTYPLFAIYGLYSLWRAVHGRSWRWAVAAGVLNGLSVYTYIASRVFPAVIALWLASLWVFHRSVWRANARRTAAVLGLAVALAAPLLVYGLLYPDIVNQRPNTMGTPLSDLQQGRVQMGLARIVDNAIKTAGMLALSGDPDERYNHAARPVFDPVVGVLSYGGLLLAALRWKRPAYLLLWGWLLIGLTPVLLSDSAPAFLRASGALFPIMLLPALSVEQGFGWLQARKIQVDTRWLTGLALSASVVLGAITTSVFHGPWRTLPESIRIYEGSLYLAARYLARHPPPAEAQLFGIAASASDNAPLLFNAQSPYGARVRWSQDMVWPADGRETWYFFHQDSLPDAQLKAWLGVPPAHVDYDYTGQPAFEIYRLEQRPAVPAAIQVMQARYDRLADLIGVHYPQPWERGQSAELQLYWRARPDMSIDLSRPIGLVVGLDTEGVRWSEGGTALLAFPPSQWRVGDVWVQRISLDIPAEIPPQVLQPVLTVHQMGKEWQVIPEGADRARLTLQLPPVTVSGAPTTNELPPSNSARFLDDLALLTPALVLPGIGAQPGLSVTIKATWQALRPMREDYVLQLRLVGENNEERMAISQVINEHVYATHLWTPGERVASVAAFRIPLDMPSGTYDLQLRVTNSSGQASGDWIAVAPLSIMGRPHLLTPPAVDQALEAVVENVGTLVGYRLDMSEVRRGGTVKITLVWRAAEASPGPLNVFVHVYDLDDTVDVYAQHDGEPGNGRLPTTAWAPEEYIEDTHLVPIPASLLSGPYRLAVGMYDPQSLNRLAIQARGQTQDALILQDIIIP